MVLLVFYVHPSSCLRGVGPILSSRSRTIIYNKAKFRHAAVSKCLLVCGGGWVVAQAECLSDGWWL